ncbi:MAG TPA: hypothetical protein VH062_05165 [Polyangiaceae bacterium]|jgi:hypothetical protein|nr:hypothetical protein [Polyangiaceae bacterium]
MKALRACAGGFVFLSAASLLACSGNDSSGSSGELGGQGGLPDIGSGSTTSLGSAPSTVGGRTGSGGTGSGSVGSGSTSSTGATSGTGGRSGGRGGTASGSGGTTGGTGGTSSSGGASNGGSGAGGSTPGKPGTVGGCSVFTPDDDWNKDISGASVDATWTTRIQTVTSTGLKLHPDYGNSGSEHYGIPINVVPASQPAVPVTFDDYADESDPGPYPFPDPGSARVEGGTPMSCDGDCHFLTVQSGTCVLYEGYACHYDGGWHCANGAKWDLKKNSYGQRPKGWTSADAAGLAVMPGLVRVDEVRSGAITHAIRFTMDCSRPNYVAPATHDAVPHACDPSNPNSPPMGLRVRLNKTKFDISKLSASAQVVAKAMQTYGMILADNGSDFYFQGEDNAGWADDDVEPLKTIPASAFEVITPPPLEN